MRLRPNNDDRQSSLPVTNPEMPDDNRPEDARKKDTGKEDTGSKDTS